MRKLLRTATGACSTAALIVGLVTSAGAAGSNLEYEVKAAFLYNFAKFVEWPSSAFATSRSPVVFCVLGYNPFDGLLDQAVKDRTVSGRHIVVKAVARGESPEGCHLAFVATSEDARLTSVLASLEAVPDNPALTVGESESFAKAKGMVRFVVDDGRLRFEVNAAEAERVGLRLSSQLLKLARTVKR